MSFEESLSTISESSESFYEEAVCRICLQDDLPLIRACQCSDPSRYVHE